MLISLIVAMSENRVMGIHNKLPWHLPADLKHFKNLTLHKPIIMGRKTFQSIGKALPERRNIIITKDKTFTADNIEIYYDIDTALSSCQNANEVMIIGGAEIFQQFLSIASKIYLTVIHDIIDGDVFFPLINENEWLEVSSEFFHKDDKNKYDYSFKVLIKM